MRPNCLWDNRLPLRAGRSLCQHFKPLWMLRFTAAEGPMPPPTKQVSALLPNTYFSRFPGCSVDPHFEIACEKTSIPLGPNWSAAWSSWSGPCKVVSSAKTVFSTMQVATWRPSFLRVHVDCKLMGNWYLHGMPQGRLRLSAFRRRACCAYLRMTLYRTFHDQGDVPSQDPICRQKTGSEGP